MKPLEGMARELFTRFSIKETGNRLNWNYLSADRKLEWMNEVLLVSKYFLDNLEKEIKPIPNNDKSSTVFESGFNSGVRSERISFTLLVENLHKKLVDEYEEYKFINNKLDKNNQ